MLVKFLNKNTLKVVLNKCEAKNYFGNRNKRQKVTTENLKYVYKIASNEAKLSPLSYASEIFIISKRKGCVIVFKQIKVLVLKRKNKNTYCYKTSSADTLLDITEKLYKNGKQKSSLYLYNNDYYLVLENKCDINENNVKLINLPYLKAYLEEYATLISNNAVNEIGVILKTL